MISDQIKKLRTENKMTQPELGKKLGVTRSSVNAWEMGISIPSLQMLVEMSKLFRVSVDYLLELDSDINISVGHLDPEEVQIILSMIKSFEKSHKTRDLLKEHRIYMTEDNQMTMIGTDKNNDT